MPNVLDLEQSILLLELEPPFGKREVQLARRRLAKVWHPDLAPPGKQFEHERHLKAINEAADQLERLAEGSRGGQVTRNAVKVNAAAARAARAEEGRRAYEAAQREREHAADKAAKFVKPIDVNEHLRGRQTQVHQWHKALTPCQYLCPARIAGQAMDGLVARARSNVLKARWLHIGLSITQNSSKMPKCKHQ